MTALGVAASAPAVHAEAAPALSNDPVAVAWDGDGVRVSWPADNLSNRVCMVVGATAVSCLNVGSGGDDTVRLPVPSVPDAPEVRARVQTPNSTGGIYR